MPAKFITEVPRRTMLKAGAVTTITAAAGVMPLLLTSAVNAKSTTDPLRGLKIGVASYSLRKMNLENAIKATQRLGISYISLKDFHLPLKSTREERQAVARRLKEAGLTLISCGVVSMKNDEAEIRNAFEYAKDAGIPTIVASPDPAAVPLLDRFVGEYNIRIAIHNHGPEDKRFPTPDSVMKVIEPYDRRIGLCIDIGHTMRAGVDPARAIRQHSRRLYDLHFKDVDRAVREGKTLEVGRGVINIPAVLRALESIKYAYHVGLEYEKDADDPVPGMAESIGYIKGVLAR